MAMRMTGRRIRQIIRESLTSERFSGACRVIDAIHNRIVQQLEGDQRIIDIAQQVAAIPSRRKTREEEDAALRSFRSLEREMVSLIREINPPALGTLVTLVSQLEEKSIEDTPYDGQVDLVEREHIEWMIINSLCVRLIWNISGGRAEFVEEEQATTSPAELFSDQFVISHRSQTNYRRRLT